MAKGPQRGTQKKSTSKQATKLLFDIKRLNPSTQKQQARTLRGVS